MLFAIALMAYIITEDYIQGGTLATDSGLTTEEAATRMYDLFQSKAKLERGVG